MKRGIAKVTAVGGIGAAAGASLATATEATAVGVLLSGGTGFGFTALTVFSGGGALVALAGLGLWAALRRR